MVPKPDNESERLQSLRNMNVVDTPGRESLDRIVRVAARLFDVPYAQINFIGEDRHWTKASHGAQPTELPREKSLAAHVIIQDEPLVLPDACDHETFAEHPQVTGEPGIRFYMGVPIESPDGFHVGSLAVYDTEPREEPGAEQVELLTELGKLAQCELAMQRMSREQKTLIRELEESRRQARMDYLTNLWNRGGIEEVMEREFERAQREDLDLGVLMLDLDNFKQVNDRFGHATGDEVLRRVAKNLRARVRPYDAVGRYGGEEFLVLLIACGPEEGGDLAERIREGVSESEVRWNSSSVSVTASVGVTFRSLHPDATAEELVNYADQASYEAKKTGNHVHVDGEEPGDRREVNT